MQLHDRNGEGEEMRRGENHECGERGNDRKCSNKWKQDGKKGSKTQRNSEGSFALYSTPSSKEE